ncbi:MAG TPA: glycosyltransferase family 4 protein [Thiobacillaceae bacterium]|nr:glycosyltransferase family 4 protein [Thiobacillaceae bacterium]HNU63927.1 glycosyltransferase family 4 protein [Thiobacillaceae bacterium]
MRKLCVAQLLPALESGGVERGTLEISRYLVARGHRSLVLSAGGRLVQTLRQEGGEHVTWDLGRKHPWTLRHIPGLRRFLRQQRVDILHARSRMPAWVGWLAWKGMAPANRPRFVTTVHGLYSVNAYSAVMTRGERVIAVSDTVRHYLLQHYPGLDAGRIVVIPRGIDPAIYPPGYHPPPDWLHAWRAQYPELSGKKVITLPGRITRLKGHEDFIELMRRLVGSGEDVHGLIVGGAEPKKRAYLEELRKRVAHADLQAHLTFTGQRSDLREIMAVSDLVLSLSSQPESFGRTVLEALSMGVPVLGYEHGGVGEQLSRYHPQGCVPLGDLDELVKKCQALQAGSRIRTPAALPTLDRMQAETLSLYQDLITQHAPAHRA